jgi:hypothetical protein
MNDIVRHPIAERRACGECSMCCKLLRITELEKPAGRWCQHCAPGKGGCTIYDTRPEICRTYACGWLMSPKVTEDWYPLRSHMVLSFSPINGINTMTCSVDEAYPHVWQREPYHGHLRNMAHAGLYVKTAKEIVLVQVRLRGRVWLVLDNRDVEITNVFYIVKAIASGKYGVEFFDTPDAARHRLSELVPVPN